jgi:hypothetical protein
MSGCDIRIVYVAWPTMSDLRLSVTFRAVGPVVTSGRTGITDEISLRVTAGEYVVGVAVFKGTTAVFIE